jgi:hypothetical protein
MPAPFTTTSASRSTGGEINPTRTLASLTYDDNDTSHTLTVSGGDLIRKFGYRECPKK